MVTATAVPRPADNPFFFLQEKEAKRTYVAALRLPKALRFKRAKTPADFHFGRGFLVAQGLLRANFCRNTCAF
jgi:hypothetical protein